MARHGLDGGDGEENADKGPENGHQIARGDRLILSISEPSGDKGRQLVPWRSGNEGIQMSINVEAP